MESDRGVAADEAPVKAADNPLDIIGKVLNSTIFLSLVALAIICGMGWAIWQG